MGEQVPSVVLGPTGRARAMVGLLGGLVVVVLLYLVVRALLPDTPPPGFLVMNILSGFLPYLLMGFRTTVTIGPAGIAFRGFGVRESFAWDDLTEVAFVGDRRVVQVGARPRGGIWEVPGPQSPTVVVVTTADAAERRSARAALERAALRHGLVYSESADGVGTSPPGGWLRKDGA